VPSTEHIFVDRGISVPPSRRAVTHRAPRSIPEDQQAPAGQAADGAGVGGPAVRSAEPEGLEGLLGLGEKHGAPDAAPAALDRHCPRRRPGTRPADPPSLHDFIVDPTDATTTILWSTRRCSTHCLGSTACECCSAVAGHVRIGDLSCHNQECRRSTSRIATLHPAHVRYACPTWASHLSSGNVSGG